MMFVDESGDPGFPADADWSTWQGSTHFARAGVIIHGATWTAWQDRMLKFKDKWGLAWSDEIKASDIRRGKNCLSTWPKTKREAFLVDLLKTMAYSKDLTLLGVSIDKRLIRSQVGTIVATPEVRSLELLLERYNNFLKSQADPWGIVILDPVKEKSDDNLRYFQQFLMAKSPKLQPRRIVEGAFFAKSHTSNMIQLADVCTNVLYREMVHSKRSPEFLDIEPLFWHKDGQVNGIGIKTWP